MSMADRLRSLLRREQWATVLVIAGASLLLVPPDRSGTGLLLWVGGVLGASFLVVLVGARLWMAVRE